MVGKVNQFINAYICVNNSYSGSKVTGEKFPSGNCDQRTSNLHTEQYTPDMILIYLGFNDFGNGVHITMISWEALHFSRPIIICCKR